MAANKTTDQKKVSGKAIAVAFVSLVIWIGGFFVASHFNGSLRLDSPEAIRAALSESTHSNGVEILQTADAGGFRAVLFDPGTPEDPADDGLALFVPDMLFRSRWCYYNVAGQNAKEPLTLFCDTMQGDNGYTVIAVYGSGIPDTVSSFTLTADGEVLDTQPITDSSLLALYRTAHPVTDVSIAAS